MGLTREQIEAAMDRADTAATAWADEQREFSHIWNGVVTRVTVDGQDYELDFTLRGKDCVGDVAKTFTYTDAETGLVIDCECLGGS